MASQSRSWPLQASQPLPCNSRHSFTWCWLMFVWSFWNHGGQVRWQVSVHMDSGTKALKSPKAALSKTHRKTMNLIALNLKNNILQTLTRPGITASSTFGTSQWEISNTTLRAGLPDPMAPAICVMGLPHQSSFANSNGTKSLIHKFHAHPCSPLEVGVLRWVSTSNQIRQPFRLLITGDRLTSNLPMALCIGSLNSKPWQCANFSVGPWLLKKPVGEFAQPPQWIGLSDNGDYQKYDVDARNHNLTDNGMKWGSKSSHIPRSKRTPSTLRSSSGTSWASLPKHTYHMGKPSVTSFGQCNQLSLKIIVGRSIIMKHIPWIVWWRAGSCLPWFVSFCNKANKYRIVASRGTNALYKM